MNNISEIKDSVIAGEDELVVELVKQAIETGIAVSMIVNDGLIGAMNVVGSKMATGEMYVPEVLMSAAAMQVGLEYLKPLLKEGDVTSRGKVVIGTVQGDLHDIGKNLVAMMLESSGYEVINLGVDQSVENFLQAAKDHQPDIIGLSALLTTTMPNIRENVLRLRESGINTKIIVGGAPVTADFATKIGADGYASDAAGAVALVKRLLS